MDIIQSPQKYDNDDEDATPTITIKIKSEILDYEEETLPRVRPVQCKPEPIFNYSIDEASTEIQPKMEPYDLEMEFYPEVKTEPPDDFKKLIPGQQYRLKAESSPELDRSTTDTEVEMRLHREGTVDISLCEPAAKQPPAPKPPKPKKLKVSVRRAMRASPEPKGPIDTELLQAKLTALRMDQKKKQIHINTLHQRNRRLKQKVATLKAVIAELHSNPEIVKLVKRTAGAKAKMMFSRKLRKESSSSSADEEAVL